MNEFLKTFTKCDIFTPDVVSSKMSEKLHKNGTLLEPSVGTGNLLKHIAIEHYEKMDIFDIKKEYLDQCPEHPKINKYLSDFLKYETAEKYDNIILNPPYIKIQDLPSDYVSFIKEKWPILSDGNIDIYYAFLFKCLELLKPDGVMVAITPNSYLHSKSALKFRKYLLENKFILK
jgi:adenine-specific DNA-methyltransferase